MTLRDAMLEEGYTVRQFKKVEKFVRHLPADDRALWDIMVVSDPQLLLHCMDEAHDHDWHDMQIVWKLFRLVAVLLGKEETLQ